MPAAVKIEYKGHIPKMSRRDQNNVIRESYEDLGKHFFDKNLPRRFTVQGSRTLSYQRRSPKHVAAKKRLFGHNLPLVFSGETRARALSSMTRIVAKAKKGLGSVELRASVPKLNFRRGNGPKMREEFERIAPQEIGPLERKLESSATKRFNEYSNSQTFSG